ncbi:MAG: aminopeptidase [Anaerolineaceae bacterium]|jgi:aminopeptidase
MTDSRIQNLAKILIHYSTKVKKDDKVMIRGFPLDPVATPLLAELYREVLRAGGHPHIEVDLENVQYIFLTEAADFQLLHPDPVAKMVAEEFDVDIRIGANTNTRALSSVKPEAWQLYSRSSREYTDTFYRRTAEGKLRWTVSRFPTLAYAQDAEMSQEEFANFFFHVTFADTENPIARYEIMRDEQDRLIRWLDGKKHIQITGPEIELEMSIEGRKFVNCCGLANVPDGEIFTGPVEDSVNGRVKYSFPCIWSGVEVTGVELEFEHGKVVRARADKNEAFLKGVLDTDPGARFLGELGIGTNFEINRFTKNMLFDEKIGGTIHLAIGMGYPETGSVNKSSVHWDMLYDMRRGSRILVDSELFYDSGKFMV